MAPLITSRRKRKTLGRGLLYLLLLLSSAVVIFPYLWMALTSFKPIEEFFTYPLVWLTKNWTLRQYAGALEDPKFLAALRNSILVSSIVTAVSLGLSIPAAYGLTRLRTPGGKPILVAILSAINVVVLVWLLYYVGQKLLAGSKMPLITLAGLIFFFRFYRTAEVPPEPFSDQAEKILDVYDVSQGQTHIFFTRNTGREGFQMYWTLLVAKVFGTGLSYFSLKLGTAILGFLTLPFMYLLGKEIGGKRVWITAFG